MITEFLAANAGMIIVAAIAAVPSAISAVFAGLVALRQAGTRKMIIEVQTAQVQDKHEITTEIQAVRYDIQNGVGEKIAVRAMEHMRPVLQEAAVVAADGLKVVAIEAAAVTTEAAASAAGKLEATADKVAQVLADKATWDGVERRVGPADRRGEKA